MALTCALLPVSFAATVIALFGLISFVRAWSFAGARELDRGRAALRTARRSMTIGLVTLGIALPAILLTLESSVPMQHRIFLATIPVATVLAFVGVLLIVDLRLQDRLRPMPEAAAASAPDETISFELTPDHLWRSQMQWQIYSPLGRITLAIGLIVILAIVFGMPVLTYSMHPQRSYLVYVIPSLFVFGVTTLLLIVFGKRIYVAVAGRQPGVLCEHRIEVRADGLREVTHANDTLWPWSDVREAREVGDYVMLRVRSIGLFSIPRSAFASDDQLRRFIDAVRLRRGTG